MKVLAIVLIAVMATVSYSVDCNATAYEFLSNYTLGKGNELNISFTKIKAKIPAIPDVVYSAKPTLNYTVTNFTTIFRYLDTSQTQQTFGKDLVIVKGGRLRVDFNLTWFTTGAVTVNGTASGFGTSDGIIFTKNLTRNADNFVMWNLLDYNNISFAETAFEIRRLEPYSEDDYNVINSMVNHIINVTTPKDYLIEAINTFLPSSLNDSLHDDSHKMDKYVNYTWKDPIRGVFNVTFDHTLLQVDLDQEGIDYFYATVIKDMIDFQCGPPVPNVQRDPKYYGGTQQFLSFGVYYSSVLYALRKGIFNSNLDQETWTSSVFQFYAGDLYDVIPVLTKKFYPSQKVSGNCNALEQGFNVTYGSPTYLNVTINFNCSLGVERTKIADFNINAVFMVAGKPKARYIDFEIFDVDATPKFNSYQEFTITNEGLATWLLRDCLRSSRGTKVFGSNFTTYTRDYPNFEVSKDGYTLIYDPTHLNASLIY